MAETIDFPSQFPDKANPDYRDVVLGYDSQSGQPISVRLETLQANSATNILGVAHPTDSPTGTETNGQSYRVSNKTGAVLVFTNFLDSTSTPVQMAADERSGVIVKNAAGWAYVDNTADVEGYTPSGGYPDSAQTLNLAKVDKDALFTGHGTQMFDKSRVIVGKRIAVNTGEIIDQEGAIVSPLIPVQGDTVYILNYRTTTNKGFRFVDASGNPLKPIYGTPTATFAADDGKPYRSPVNAIYAQFNIAADGDAGVPEGIMFAESSIAVPYEDYEPKVGAEMIADLPDYTKSGGFNGSTQDLANTVTANNNMQTANSTAAQTAANNAQSTANTAKNDAATAKALAQGTIDLLDGKVDKSSKGVANGVASLGADGKVPASQLNLTGAIPVGNYDPTTNTPALADGTGTVNNYYIVTADGSHDFGNGSITFKKGDKVIYSSEGKWLNNSQQEVPSPVSTNGLTSSSLFIRVNDNLFNIYNEFTSEYESFKKVTTFPNGLAISDSNIDNVIYRKIGSEYFANTGFLANGDVHLKSYGCACDGTTNDQPLIQFLVNFLNAIGGGTLRMPLGRIRLLNQGIKVYSNISIMGYGKGKSIFQCDATTSSNDINGIYNIDMPSNGSTWNPLINNKFTGFTLDCSGYHNIGTSAVGRKGIFILGMEYFAIHDVEVYKSIGTGIGCDFLSRGAITNCLVRECGKYIGDGYAAEIGQSGIGIGSCSIEDESVLVQGNFCIDNGNYQIFLETQNNPSGIKSKWAKIVDNHCIGGRYGIGNKGSGGAIIARNTCYYQTINAIDLRQYTLNNMVFQNDCGYSGKHGIYMEYINDGIGDSTMIMQNKCHHNAQCGVYCDAGTTPHNMNVCFNECYFNGYSGILLSYYHFNNRVKGNVLFSNGQAGLATNCYGLFIRQGYGTIVEDNLFYDNQETKTQLKAMYVQQGKTSTGAINFPALSAITLKGNTIQGYSRANAVSLDPLLTKSDVILKGNIGFEDELDGLASFADSDASVTVAHGLGFAPNFVSITPKGNYPMYVTDIDSTSFKINRYDFSGAVDALWKASLN